MKAECFGRTALVGLFFAVACSSEGGDPQEIGEVVSPVVGVDTHFYFRCNATSWGVDDTSRLVQSSPPEFFTLTYQVSEDWMVSGFDTCTFVETNQLNGWGTQQNFFDKRGDQLLVVPAEGPGFGQLRSWIPGEDYHFQVKYPATGTYRVTLNVANGAFFVEHTGTHRVDVLLYQNLQACAVGNPCTAGDCVRFSDPVDPDDPDDDVVELEFQADASFQVLKPSDPAVANAPYKHCFSAVMDTTEVVETRDQLQRFRDDVFEWTDGALDLALVVHEIPGPTPITMTLQGVDMKILPWDVEETALPLISPDTDFVIATHGLFDPATGWRMDNTLCGGSYGASLGLAGSGFSWVPKTRRVRSYECANPTVYTFEWMHQVRYGLLELSGYDDLYTPGAPTGSCPFFSPPPVYPACGMGASDPTLWLPDHELCASDPDYVRCGGECDMPEFLEHVLRVHWDRDQVLITNHCKDGIQDCTETGVDSGGACL